MLFYRVLSYRLGSSQNGRGQIWYLYIKWREFKHNICPSEVQAGLHDVLNVVLRWLALSEIILIM